MFGVGALEASEYFKFLMSVGSYIVRRASNQNIYNMFGFEFFLKRGNGFECRLQVFFGFHFDFRNVAVVAITTFLFAEVFAEIVQ